MNLKVFLKSITASMHKEISSIKRISELEKNITNYWTNAYQETLTLFMHINATTISEQQPFLSIWKWIEEIYLLELRIPKLSHQITIFTNLSFLSMLPKPIPELTVPIV